MIRRSVISLLIAAVLITWDPEPSYASPDPPMCVANPTYVSVAPSPFGSWRGQMCGPWVGVIPIAATETSEALAIAAYRRAIEQIGAADYDQARLQLDLAHRGLPRIADRIALQGGRLELLRGRPTRAAAFFTEASKSPHQSVRVEADFGRVLSLVRADDAAAATAITGLFDRYPQIPKRAELLYEHARSLLRQRRYAESVSVMHTLRFDHPATRMARWADTEIARLEALGFEPPRVTDGDRVRRARNLVETGPLDQARGVISGLLEAPLTSEQRAEVHYLAGLIARFEGRWQAAETYMRSAQLFPAVGVESAKRIEDRAKDLARTARARDPVEASRRLSELRAGRQDSTIPSFRLVEMLEVASAAGLQDEVDALLSSLDARKGVRAEVLFDAAMAAHGPGSTALIVSLLEEVASRPTSRYKAAALYHTARAQERAGRPSEARALFAKAKAIADHTGDAYYALWASNGLRRLDNEQSDGREGLEEPGIHVVPQPPSGSTDALADRLAPIARRHDTAYPWIARAVDLLRVGDRNAATEELFETYLRWREAQGRPIARAGLDSVARADARTVFQSADDSRLEDIHLSESERTALADVAASLGDMGIAGGFVGPKLLETRPRAYEWLVVPAGSRHGLDPNLLLAVMRVESAYQKHIVSYAGAIGLMQIMPRTGRLIAHALDQPDFTPADLLDPRLNLEFAAWYLTSLIRRFDGHLPLAIAAYNGGPHNVRRWIQESAPDIPVDVLLERIPFSQTHRYVRKVLVHYEAYRQQRDLRMPQLSVAAPEQRVDPLAF